MVLHALITYLIDIFLALSLTHRPCHDPVTAERLSQHVREIYLPVKWARVSCLCVVKVVVHGQGGSEGKVFVWLEILILGAGQIVRSSSSTGQDVDSTVRTSAPVSGCRAISSTCTGRLSTP